MRRRSLSLDSCADKNLYLALRTIVLPPQQLCSALLQEPQGSAAVSGKRLRRSFFSFSHGRSSQTLILPISTQM
ncbi:hypothetical protein E2562_007278 [Oryza meyeriana var. granulata]|uniref:Uncharacterized protein n=1 Tax=Oryza meyeriana var. granulata TaxID=110450 RepID=A0A6G1CE42_9ORYZ|nr:hypothetical protein E2562_007278 [Oryza meyeriana var. granulata]